MPSRADGAGAAANALRRRSAGIATWLLVLVPGALVVAFGFSAGGFFPGTVAFGALGLGLALVVRLTLARRPLEGLSPPYVLGAAALGLFALWTLISSAWSGAPARALVEYDRALLYLLAFVLFGALGRTPGRLRWMTRAIALGAVAVCACALVTRVAPDVWHVAPGVQNDRLSFPLTYWNALGLVGAIGLVLCFALTSDAREPAPARVLAAAALPVLGATILLTFSRGAFAASIAGVVTVIVVGRPRALLSGLLVAAPAVAIAIRAAYDADLLATADPTTAAATAQGHHVATVVALCVAGAAAARAVLLVLDALLARLSLPERLQRPIVGWAASAGLAVALVAVAVALGAPGYVERQYHGFVRGTSVATSGAGLRARLTNPGNNGRIPQWDVALKGFEHRHWRGQGAGTYPLLWDRYRELVYQVEDAHSLYVEVLGELGLVGLVLIASSALLVLGGFLARARGPDRVVGAALFGAGLAWALRAGVDWDWEMPALTLWVFAAGAMALSARVGDAPARSGPVAIRNPLRVAVAAGCLVVLVVPLAIYRSQGPLNEAARSFAGGDCAATIDHALDSIAALHVRHEPWVLVGYCDVRLGRPALGVRALTQAVRLDPHNWETHYGLALVRGAAGLDPRPEARIARRLDPGDKLPYDAVRRFDSDDRRVWQRRALRAPLPTD